MDVVDLLTPSVGPLEENEADMMTSTSFLFKLCNLLTGSNTVAAVHNCGENSATRLFKWSGFVKQPVTVPHLD